MRKIFFLSLLLTFLFTSSTWAADVSGTWILKYTGNQGDERALDMVIKGEGENLTVSTTHPSLGEMTGTGTLKGNDIKITLTATGERKIGFELTGTVTGDKMAGTREVKIPDDARESARGGDQSSAQRSRRDASGDDQSGAQRGARGDSSSGEKAGPQGGASSKAPARDSSKAKETSKAWTAERK